MSGWKFQDVNGQEVELNPRETGKGVVLEAGGGELVRLLPEEAVGIAGNLIAFSRAEATITPGKLPEVTIEALDKNGPLYCLWRDEQGIAVMWDLNRGSIEKARQLGLGTLAIAKRIEEYFDSEEHATKVRQERRDAIAVELGTSPLGYADTFDTTQRAIDRIIELEDKLKESK